MKFEVGNKTVEIKFNYRLMFRINKYLSTKDKDGVSTNTGVGDTFVKILDQNDQVLVDLIQLCSKDKVSESQAVSAIEKYLEESEDEEPYEALFDELKNEMLSSGFFAEKISKYAETTESMVDMLKAVDKRSEEQEMAIKHLEGVLAKIKQELY